MSWTEERVETLKKLWTEGHSASQIAKELGGVTRNAVIGKVHRLGLSGRATPSRPVKRPTRLVRPKPATVVATPDVPKEEDVAAPVKAPSVPARANGSLAPIALENGETATVLNIKDSMCKWPIGDPADASFAFCGRASPGGPYCSEHAKLAFQPQKKRTRATASYSGSRRAHG